MQDSNKSNPEPTHIGLLLFDGFSNHCVANLIEPLRAANTLGGRALYTWRYVTTDGAGVESSSGLRILPEVALSDMRGDVLMVAPSYGFRALCRPDVIRSLRAAAGRFDQVAGLDTGSWLLAEAGLLDGYRATIHPEEITALAEQFPKVSIEQDRYVIDGKRITCSGAMAAFDLSLHMVLRDGGAKLALEVEQLFVTRDATTTPAEPVLGRSKLVRAAIAFMNQHLETPVSISRISSRLSCTQRRLEAAFKDETGITPQHVYRRQRLVLARRLAQTTRLPMAEIAVRSGYQDASAMARAFRSEFGLTPSEARQIAQR
jgi:transcriptional regulator GlxA family with amidase domain